MVCTIRQKVCFRRTGALRGATVVAGDLFVQSDDPLRTELVNPLQAQPVGDVSAPCVDSLQAQPAGVVRQVAHRSPLGARAFTMLETLLVLVVGGMLLLAAAGFLFGTIGLRRQIEEAPQLKQHAASVGRLLEGVIASAQPQQGAAAGNAEGSVAAPIGWQALPDVVFGSEQALYLRVRPGLPVFVSQEGTTQTTVSCYLLFERDNGLVLLWQNERMRRDDERNWERTVLSPLVSAMRLLYYDAERERWEETEGLEPLFGTPERLPQVMQITFRQPGMEREESIEVLLPPESTPLLGL